MNTSAPPPKTAPRPPEDARATSSARRKLWRSPDLFGVDQEVSILHDGEEYRLRITSKNKLILTK